MLPLDRRSLRHCFLLLMILLTSCNCRPRNPLEKSYELCASIPKSSWVVNLSFCGIEEFPNFYFGEYVSMTSLNLSYNNLTKLSDDLFKYNLNLTRLDLSFNPNFGRDFENGKCYIKSDSIIQLNLDHTGLGVIHPEDMCIPNLKVMYLIGVKDCAETRKLFKRKKPVNIFCGGSVEDTTLPAFNPPSSLNIGPYKTTDSLNGTTIPTSTLAHPSSSSSDTTTPQPGTTLAFATNMSKTYSSPPTTLQPSPGQTSGEAHEVPPNSTIEPVIDETVNVWVVVGVVGVLVVGIAVLCYCFRQRLYESLCLILGYVTGRLTNTNPTAITDGKPENSCGVEQNESNEEQSLFLQPKKYENDKECTQFLYK